MVELSSEDFAENSCIGLKLSANIFQARSFVSQCVTLAVHPVVRTGSKIVSGGDNITYVLPSFHPARCTVRGARNSP